MRSACDGGGRDRSRQHFGWTYCQILQRSCPTVPPGTVGRISLLQRKSGMTEIRPAAHGGDVDLNNGLEVPCLATAKSANSQPRASSTIESRAQPTSEKDGSCC